MQQSVRVIEVVKIRELHTYQDIVIELNITVYKNQKFIIWLTYNLCTKNCATIY